MQSCKLFLFPYYYESFAIAVAEAMACGLPVVAYDLPTYHDIYPKGMIRASLANTNLFAKKVLNLLTNDKLRNRLTKEAIKVASNFTWEKPAQLILDQLKNKI